MLRRLTIQGFIVRDFEASAPEFEERVGGWLASGELVDRATVFEGIENAGAGLEGLLVGREPRQGPRPAVGLRGEQTDGHRGRRRDTVRVRGPRRAARVGVRRMRRARVPGDGLVPGVLRASM